MFHSTANNLTTALPRGKLSTSNIHACNSGKIKWKWTQVHGILIWIWHLESYAVFLLTLVKLTMKINLWDTSHWYRRCGNIQHYWWLVRVTLLVAFGFLLQNFGKWWGPTNDVLIRKWMQLEWWGQSEGMGTLNPYLKVNSFKYSY